MSKVLYSPPELTPQEIARIKIDLETMVRTRGVFNVTKVMITLAVENAQIVKECNDLRSQLGIDPRPVYEPSGGKPRIL
jgi:hypothetical protein